MALRRGVGLVLGLLLIAVLVSAAGMALLWSVAAREPAVARNSTLVLQLDTDLHEASPDDVMRQLFAGPAPASLGNVLEVLRKAKVDPRVGAIVVAPSRLQAPLWAKVQEVRAGILDFRSSGKPAYAYLEYADDRGYYLATACSRILLMPSSQLSVNGLASYSVFLRGAFDKLDAFPDFLHVGRYKTAANQFTEKGFTPADREMTEALNTDMYEQLVQGIAAGRKKTEAEVRALIDQGPFLAADALKAGLVDDLAYADQIDDKLRLPGGSMRELNLREYTRVSASSLGLNRGPKIALLQANGVIVSGASGFDAMNGAVLGSDTFIKYIREARSDPSVRAIVLRVDSPGGLGDCLGCHLAESAQPLHRASRCVEHRLLDRVALGVDGACCGTSTDVSASGVSGPSSSRRCSSPALHRGEIPSFVAIAWWNRIEPHCPSSSES